MGKRPRARRFQTLQAISGGCGVSRRSLSRGQLTDPGMSKTSAQDEIVAVLKASRQTFEFLAYVFTVLGLWAGGLFLAFFLLGIPSPMAAYFAGMIALVGFLVVLLVFSIRRQQELHQDAQTFASSESGLKQQLTELQSGVQQTEERHREELDEKDRVWKERLSDLERQRHEEIARLTAEKEQAEARAKELAGTAEKATKLQTELTQALGTRDQLVKQLDETFRTVNARSETIHHLTEELRGARDAAQRERQSTERAPQRAILQPNFTTQRRLLSPPKYAIDVANISNAAAKDVRLNIEKYDRSGALIEATTPYTAAIPPKQLAHFELGSLRGVARLTLRLTYKDIFDAENQTSITWPVSERAF